SSRRYGRQAESPLGRQALDSLGLARRLLAKEIVRDGQVLSSGVVVATRPPEGRDVQMGASTFVPRVCGRERGQRLLEPGHGGGRITPGGRSATQRQLSPPDSHGETRLRRDLAGARGQRLRPLEMTRKPVPLGEKRGEPALVRWQAEALKQRDRLLQR